MKTQLSSFGTQRLQQGLSLLQMLALIGIAGLLGAWLLPLLLDWVRRLA